MGQDAVIEAATFVETRPGLDELVSRGSTPDSLTTAVQQFLATPGVRDSGLGDQLAAVIDERGRSARPGAGLLGSVRRLFARRELVVAATHQTRLPLRTFWLCVPPVPDASTTFNLEVGGERKISASIEIFGLGGGPSIDILVSEGIERTVDRSEQIELAVPVMIERVEIRRDGELELSYPRLAGCGSPRVWNSSEADDPSPAGTPAVTYDLADDRSPTTVTVSVERGTTWTGSLGLTIEALGLDTGLDYETTTAEQCSYSYELPPGHRFVAHRQGDRPGYFWSVERG
jgi:hypothetical protein